MKYDVVVPLKRLDRAKSRLAPVGDPWRRELALAFLADTLAAVVAAASVADVAVVSDDEAVPALLAAEGLAGRVSVVADPGTGDLNDAFRAGAGTTGTGRGTGVVALCADLPGLVAADLDAFLAAVPVGGRGVVVDHTGTGTTAYAVGDRSLFEPRFGPGSAAAHLRQGAVDLGRLVGTGLRRDADDPVDLAALHDLLGPRTAAVLARHTAAG